ncbi:general secretion pathway protein GspK [bacterium]|nr:general secretion pathway protein GspK [bacterium]
MRMLDGNGRRGALLVLTLWLIIVLMVMAYSLSYEMRIGMKMTSQGRKRVEALGLARAGLAKGVTDLKNDQMLKVSEGLYNNDHLKDIWALEDDKTDVKLGEGTYTVRIIDEQGKIDVNMLRPESINAIKYLLKYVSDVKDDDAELMANALIDFLDTDNKPITGEDESEAQFYTAEGWSRFSDSLPEGWEFRPKNDRLLNIDELMEVPGFTREVLYGKSGKVPLNPIDRLDSKKRSTALVDYLTVGQGGPVNINTAPVEVYGALLSIGQQGRVDVRRAASAIDELRKDLTNRRGKNGTGFMSPAQLSEAKVDPVLLQGMLQSPLGVSSREYTIISRGRMGAVSQTLEARVVISLQSYNLDVKGEPGLQYIHDLKAMGFLKNRPDFIVDPVLKVTQMKQY